MARKIFRLIVCLSGLFGFGIIIAEVLKKKKWVDSETSLLWIISPILMLFICRELAISPLITENPKLPQHLVRIFVKTIHVIFIVISIIVCIGFPFIWFGVIEELGKSGGM